MELQKLDIDKYLAWYKEICKEIELRPFLEAKYKRMCLTSFALFVRFTQNNNNVLSKKSSEDLLKEAKIINDRLRNNTIYNPEWYLKKGLDFKYKIFSYNEWQIFDKYRGDFLNTLIGYFEDKSSRSSIQEIELLKNELELKNSEGLTHLVSYESGTPISTTQESFSILFDLANDVSNIDFCKWLSGKIEDLQPLNIEGLKLLKWNLSKMELSELIKSLYLVNAFNVRSENEIVKAFEILTGERLQRHSANINDMQDKPEKELRLTDRMSKEIGRLIKKQLTAKRLK